ncbi:MAG: hypothetical protein ACKVHE_18935 [Planctomycetales bacterium]|jgi:hypothetical protein
MLNEVNDHADTALKIVLNGLHRLLDVALNHLTLGRVAIHESVLAKSELRLEEGAGAETGVSNPKSEIEQAVSGLRRSGRNDILPLGFFPRVFQRFITSERSTGVRERGWRGRCSTTGRARG